MIKTLLVSSAAAALAASALAAPSAGAAPRAAAAPAGQITIDVVSVNGSGCRPGSATVAVSEDNTAFTVTYSEYLSQIGMGAKPTDFRKNCQLGLRVNVPQGYTYAVSQTDYRGFASLAPGARATQSAGYYFQGMSATARRSHSVQGPFQGDWQATDTVGIEALVFKPCGTQRDFNINTELLVSAGTSDTAATNSFMAMDSTDGNIATKYHFAWKQCPTR